MTENYRIYVHDGDSRRGYVFIGNRKITDGELLTMDATSTDLYIEIQASANLPDRHHHLAVLNQDNCEVWSTYLDFAAGSYFALNPVQVVYRVARELLAQPGRYVVRHVGPESFQQAIHVLVTTGRLLPLTT